VRGTAISRARRAGQPGSHGRLQTLRLLTKGEEIDPAGRSNLEGNGRRRAQKVFAKLKKGGDWGMWISILKGAGIAAVGALLTYGTTALQALPPEWVPAVTAAWAVVVNVVRKWVGASKSK
jgi:hypothetical protein